MAGQGIRSFSIHATLEDVERKRHKKNPFDGKYVSFCLADLAQVSGARSIWRGRWWAALPLGGCTSGQPGRCGPTAASAICRRPRPLPPAKLPKAAQLLTHAAAPPPPAQSIEANAKPAAGGRAAAAQQQDSQGSEEGVDGGGGGELRDEVESAAAQIHARIEVGLLPGVLGQLLASQHPCARLCAKPSPARLASLSPSPLLLPLRSSSSR
jgi:hypothetical protein